jgi:hypothetical protein
MPLDRNQIEQIFNELSIPRSRITEGSPIDIVCPYEKLHTKHDGRRVCRLWFDEYPHLFCFHDHCLEALQELNTWLRLLVLGTTEFPDSAEAGNGQEPKVPGDFAYAKTVARKLPRLIKRFMPRSWPPEPIAMSAPAFLRRLKVFKKDDLIWIGLERSSGQPMHVAHFRTLSQWKLFPPPPQWSFTTGAAFIPNCFRRSKSTVKAARALILESDTYPPAETFALARWIEEEFTLPFLAAVNSGNKSLHCYFPCPGRDWIDRYRPALLATGFDRKLLSPAQPARLANQKRADNGATQSLLWLKTSRVSNA